MALGAIGGAAMLAWLMIDAALHHASPLTPLRLFGGTLLGPEALTGGVGSLLPGLLLHLVISAVLGVPFHSGGGSLGAWAASASAAWKTTNTPQAKTVANI